MELPREHLDQLFPALGAGGIVYVAAMDMLYALSPVDGSQQWMLTTPTRARIVSSPAVDANGTIYCGDINGLLYAVNSADGSLAWSLALGGVIDSSPALGANGTLYVGARARNLSAVAQATLPILTLNKSAMPTNPMLGDTVTYTLSYTNTGLPSAGITLSDTLPANLSYVQGSAGTGAVYDPTSGTLTWSPGALATYQTGQVTFQATVNPDTPLYSTISNTALITCAEAPSAPVSSNAAVITIGPMGLGLLGTYYNGTSYNSFISDRIDPQLDFDWSAFPATVSASNSEVWSGQVLAPVTGAYTFYANAYGYTRLQVNGQLLYDWTNSWSYGWVSGTITLQAGQLYDITLQYYEPGWYDELYMCLDWSYPGQSQQAIPRDMLYGPPSCMLSNTLLSNTAPAGSTVAALQGAPGETGEAEVPLVYTLVPGDGSDNNASFTITGSTLFSAVTFNYAVQQTYNIRVRTTDGNGVYSEFPFTLQVYTPPIVANPIPQQEATALQGFNYNVPADTFSDAQGVPLSYSATLADGTPLPAWLNFYAGSIYFYGTPAVTDVGTLQISRHRHRSGQPAGVRALHPRRAARVHHRAGAGLAGQLLQRDGLQ